MGRLMHALAVLSLALRAAPTLGAYPATYPLDEEPIQKTEGLPPAEPNFSFYEDDPGGYAYKALECNMDEFEDNVGFPGFSIATDCFFFTRRLPVAMSLPNDNRQIFNCSANGVRDSNYFGELPGYFGTDDQYCTPSECCKQWYGSTIWSRGVGESFVEVWATMKDTGMCGPWNEPVYCAHMVMFDTFCLEQYLSPTERVLVHACYTIALFAFYDCPVFVTGGLSNKNTDPDHYFDSMSIDNTLLVTAMFGNTDRVCHPYVYYFPEAAGSSSESEEIVDDDSSSMTVVCFFLILALVVA